MNLLQRQDLPIPTAPFSFSVPDKPTTETLKNLVESCFLAIVGENLFNIQLVPLCSDTLGTKMANATFRTILICFPLMHKIIN
jgi:hypothetical protein